MNKHRLCKHAKYGEDRSNNEEIANKTVKRVIYFDTDFNLGDLGVGYFAPPLFFESLNTGSEFWH